MGKAKDKLHPFTDHERPEEEQSYSSTLSLTSTLDGVAGQRHSSAALPPREGPGTHCIGGWVGMDDCRKYLAHTGTRSPDHPARSEPLYRLSHPGPQEQIGEWYKVGWECCCINGNEPSDSIKSWENFEQLKDQVGFSRRIFLHGINLQTPNVNYS